VASKERKGAKQINCQCGFVAHGESDQEVVDAIRAHMREDHPEVLEKVSQEDLLGWIEER
jgi:predicted small metal-binding protein